jgi:hypothetical protein
VRARHTSCSKIQIRSALLSAVFPARVRPAELLQSFGAGRSSYPVSGSFIEALIEP